MTDDYCINCEFYNPNVEYNCDLSTDLPVVCSVKMKKIKQEKKELRNT